MTAKKRTSARPSNSAPGHGKRHAKGSASGPNNSEKSSGGSGTSANSRKRPGGSNASANSGKTSASPAKGGLGPRKTDNFNKFYNKKRNSAIKEAFRQEKKVVKRERKEAIERHFEEKRLSRGDGQQPHTGPDPRQRPADRERRARPGITGRPEPAGKATGRSAPALT